jgi:hypothetical protein
MPSLLAFVRLASNPLVVRQPVSPETAWKQAAEWLSAEPAWIPLPTDRHAAVVARYFQEPWMTSRLMPDAHLAGLRLREVQRLDLAESTRRAPVRARDLALVSIR